MYLLNFILAAFILEISASIVALPFAIINLNNLHTYLSVH